MSTHLFIPRQNIQPSFTRRFAPILMLGFMTGLSPSAAGEPQTPPVDAAAAQTESPETTPTEPVPAAPPTPENTAGSVVSDAAPPAAPSLSPLDEAAALMKKRGLKNCKKAVDIFRAELSKSPNSADLQINTADALNCVMRIKTNGNALLIKGTNDTPAHKKVWAKWGKDAVELAEKGYTQRPNDLRALAVYTDSFMFHSSSFGILKSALTGAADTYKDNAKNLIKINPSFDGGIGYVFMGAFYLIAPWPLSDKELAREFMDKALAVAPKSRRNNYYVGVVAYRQKDYDRAATYFEKALTMNCSSPTERDFCSFMKKESARGLEKAKEKQGG